jgi:tetratricopeptide (TPR) repeat protein
MDTLPRRAALLFLLLAPSSPALAQAQAHNAPPSASHKHYTEADAAAQAGRGGELAPRLQNLGTHTFRVSTTHAGAQRFMNQGLNLSYAFNHAEARRAFREAARLSPTLAMAYWGQALVLGPNINALMEPNDEPHALELARKAQSLKARATPRERALIDALATRYSGTPEQRVTNDRAYAVAMRKVHERFPADPDIAMLYVESMMDLRPWGYWMPDGRPHEGTAEIVAVTERVMRAHPRHPGALHMYIHLIEPTTTPERAEKAADTLLTLMPAAGHIVHMPSHIYQRVGRYADAMKSNRLAVAADEDYITQCRAQGLYPLVYYPHNLHFIWMGATAAGQGALALDSARKLAGSVPPEALSTVPILQGFLVVPYWAMVRFGQWDAILSDAGPRMKTPFTEGVWRYARAMALTSKGRLDEATQELARLRTIVDDATIKAQTTFSANSGFAQLRIAPEVVAGEIAARKKDWDTATHHLERAIRFEDALIYQEPADWHAPVRQTLGAVLLEAGRADEAETVFWEDLKKNPEIGWSLFGLKQALEAQGKKDEAALVEARFRKAWKEADLTLQSARVK